MHLQLFGSPRILRDGQPLVFDTRKAVALLAHLAVTGTRHRRESLAGLVWPEADPTRARATLRRTLSVAAAVGPVLRMEGPEVWLEGASCDVIAFEAGLAAGGVTDLQQAVELASGPFLAGFALRDSPTFDGWQAMTADGLRDGLAGALGALTVAMAGRGDVGAALGEAPDAAEQARPWNVLGMVALAEGDPESGLAAFTRSVEMAARTDAAEVTVAAWHNRSRALHLLGRIDEAQEAAERARALAEQEADVHRIAVVESNLADILHAQGRTDEARALQTSSADALARVALPHQRPEVWLIADW